MKKISLVFIFLFLLSTFSCNSENISKKVERVPSWAKSAVWYKIFSIE
ncbi:MAG: hypothetical protein IPH62_09800 [Ignavibacteriae bacterium]|nr:hypothetical protein [Ignavibacteriota bacterium]